MTVLAIHTNESRFCSLKDAGGSFPQLTPAVKQRLDIRVGFIQSGLSFDQFGGVSGDRRVLEGGARQGGLLLGGFNARFHFLDFLGSRKRRLGRGGSGTRDARRIRLLARGFPLREVGVEI